MATGRVNFDVSLELKSEINKWPWGIRAAVFRAITQLASDAYNKHGAAALGAIVDGQFRLEPVSNPDATRRG